MLEHQVPALKTSHVAAAEDRTCASRKSAQGGTWPCG